MAKPIYEDFLTIPVSCLSEATTFFVCDKGRSLTKVLHGRRNGDFAQLTCRTYKTSDIDVALDWMATSAVVTADSEIKVTGVDDVQLCSKIVERMKCRAVFVDEVRATQRGAQLLLQQAENAEIFYPDPKLLLKSSMKGDSETWNQFNVEKCAGNDLYPTLFVHIGSTMEMTWIDEGDVCMVTNSSGVGDETFFGLANLMLDTIDFKEINDLAMKGDRTKIDLTGSDLFGQCQDASYAAFPGDMSIFNFGKFADTLNIEDLSKQITKEDKAAALIGFFSQIFLSIIHTLVMGQKGNRIVVSGCITRSQFFREICYSNHRATAIFHGDKVLKFVKTTHTAGLGALVADSKSLSD